MSNEIGGGNYIVLSKLAKESNWDKNNDGQFYEEILKFGYFKNLEKVHLKMELYNYK